ncbi:MAG: hypothetical protein IPN36_02655 [Bacteroidetes bacterium]|nr:hypothetical protein [Bacteroidota bacterium]
MNKILSADGGINIKSSLLVKQNLHTAVKSEIQVGILGGTTSVFQIIDGEHDSKFERKVTSAVFGLKLNFVNELGKEKYNLWWANFYLQCNLLQMLCRL